jgi:uncharacterized pyridoxamine 5'-phosphate oxidase family protein
LGKLETGNKMSLNFQGIMKEDDFKKIINNKNIKNYSVKNQNNEINVSGLIEFNNNNEKDKFLNEWSSKINSYNVDLDENT